MHIDHNIFVKGIQSTRKITLTYFDNEIKLNFTKLSVPLYYRPSRHVGNDSDCYYFWFSEAAGAKHFLELPASHIVSMDLTDEVFDPERLTISDEAMSDNKTEKQKLEYKDSTSTEPASAEYDEIAKLAKHLAAKIKASSLSGKEKRSGEGAGNGRQDTEAMQKNL
jgi:hypothetical protein